MAVDASRLRAELGNVPMENVNDAILNDCLAVADALLQQYAGADYLAAPPAVPIIPTVVAERALLSVAVELFNQRRAPNGFLTQQFATPDGAVGGAVRIGTDPLRPAYGLLERYVTDVGIA